MLEKESRSTPAARLDVYVPMLSLQPPVTQSRHHPSPASARPLVPWTFCDCAVSRGAHGPVAPVSSGLGGVL